MRDPQQATSIITQPNVASRLDEACRYGLTLEEFLSWT
jgi:hypothetical protein